MNPLLLLLEVAVWTLVCWVAVFSLALYAKIPIITLGVGFVVLWLAMVVVFRPALLRRIRGCRGGELAFARHMLALGCMVGLVVLLASRPDADDVTYLHQMLLDASEPGGYISADPFYVPVGGRRVEVPLLAENEAYEALVVVMARITGIEALQLYHNAFAFLAAILFVATYALLFRRFRVPRHRVWIAVLATVVFLFLDGNLHRSFGNFTLIRIWQGKIIVWAILGPAFLLFSLRYFARPSLYRLALVCGIGFASFSMNRSSILLFTVSGLAVAASHFLVGRWNGAAARRAAWLVAATAPLWLLAAYLVSSLVAPGTPWTALLFDPGSVLGLKSPGTANAAVRFFSRGTWWQSLRDLVVGDMAVFSRDATFLFLVPLFALRRPLGRFLVLLSLWIVILAMSPLSGPFWHTLVPMAYWRFYFVLPLPLCVGLATNAWSRPWMIRRCIAAKALLALALVSLVVSTIDRPVLSSANGVSLKGPLQFRLRRDPLTFARAVMPCLAGKKVLAPNKVANVLALVAADEVDLVYGRRHVTDPVETAIGRCGYEHRAVRDMVNSRGVDALILASCGPHHLARLRDQLLPLELVEERIESVAGRRYRLFWVDRPAAAPP